jgi:hypothetical protein
MAEFGVALAMLAVLVVLSRVVLADEGNRLPKWIPRPLRVATPFGLSTLLLVAVAYVVTLGIAGMGRNPIEVENGKRVAHFGVPFRFATSDIDESPEDKQLGTDAWWNPLETPTEFEEAPLRRSTAVVFALLAGCTLLPWALVADVRARRRRA